MHLEVPLYRTNTGRKVDDPKGSCSKINGRPSSDARNVERVLLEEDDILGMLEGESWKEEGVGTDLSGMVLATSWETS